MIRMSTTLEKSILSEKLFIVSKLDIDSKLPDTPTLNGILEKEYFPIAASALFTHIELLGLYPVVYEGENDGELIRHVVPKDSNTQMISSHGSNLTFFPHVDNPDLKLRSDVEHWIKTPCPDTLTLFCLRNSENVETSLIKLDDILQDLTPSEIEVLQSPLFTTKRPASFSGSFEIQDLRLLEKDKYGNFLSRFDFHNTLSQCERGYSALESFKKSALDKGKWIHFRLQAGESITFDNQRCLHTRNNFMPLKNGKARWLLRVFGQYSTPCPSTIKDHKYHLKTQ